MDFNLLLSFADIKTKIVPFIIAILFFGLMIGIHEFGHFIFAKLFGVKVNEFAIGMGPTLLKKKGKETTYALRLFPIGGFVSMEGEEEESADNRAYCNQKTWKRMIIIAAGATFNIILGVIICFFLVGSEDLVATNEILRFQETAVSNQQGGLQAGDKIIKIDGKRVFSDYDLTYLMQRNTTGVYDFTVERQGERVELTGVGFLRKTGGNFSYDDDCIISSLRSKMKDYGLKDGDKLIGVNGEAVANGDELLAAIGKDEDFIYDFTVEREGEVLEFTEVKLATVTVFDFVIIGYEKNVLNVTKMAFGTALSMGRMVYLSLFDILSGQYGMNEISGPIGTISVIADITEESIATVDWTSMFMLFAMITINIGIFNLLPVPALDGGHLFFMLFELIFRKRIPQKYESYIHAAGLVILLGFMAIISATDIWKIVSGRGFY